MRKHVNFTLGIAVFLSGITICLLGAALMAFGEGLLGENHTGIATVIGIVGIGIIATSSKSPKETKSLAGGVLND
jgi:hypothetical protein